MATRGCIRRPLPLTILYLLTIVVLSLLPTGCFFSSHSFNHGKLLNPGESKTTLSFGTFRRTILQQKNTWPIETFDTLLFRQSAYRWSYALGLLDRHPFGKGFEIGLAFEGSYYSYRDQWGHEMLASSQSPQMEFFGRFGLPALVLERCLYHHNISSGWSLGYWIDNGWFLEYAAGLQFGRFIPYIASRVTVTATDIFQNNDSPTDTNFFNKHDRSFMIRNSVGVTCILPKYFLAPDHISPEVTVVYPDPQFRKPCFTFQIGLGWHNGL